MSPSQHQREDAPFFFADYPALRKDPWEEVHNLAECAGVSVERLCLVVADATRFAREQKTAAPLAPWDTSHQDLEDVIWTLADDEFDLETKSDWNEWEHPRDEQGRFSNGGAHETGSVSTSSPPPHVNWAQAHKELTRVHDAVRDLYPTLPSRWAKELHIIPKSILGSNGQKSWQCHITIAQEQFADPARKLCTMIHESLHAVSPSTEPQYNRASKWEEGVIEGAVRVHRAQVAKQLGVSVSEERFEARDNNHGYNKYVNALEDMRRGLGIGDVRSFYDDLMKLPADKIEGFILSQATDLSSRDRAKFDRTFAIGKAILEDRFKP